MSWCAMTWMTSFKHHQNSVPNKRNIVSQVIGQIFLFVRTDVPNARLSTSESCEHTYSEWRSICREPTVLGMTQLSEKEQRIRKGYYKSNLKKYQSARQGYQATFGDFLRYTKNTAKCDESLVGP
eukprot:6029625-Ditylum_brightwellii.AAC.1